MNVLYVLVMFICVGIGWIFGNYMRCPPCIEQSKACPAEDIWVNTTYGFINFEKGEIDANPPYILRKHDMDELYQKIEQEILKQRGNAS